MPVTAIGGLARTAVHRLHRQQHRNPCQSRLPYYAENRPDALGYVANPAGSSFVDRGVGNFLTKGHLLSSLRGGFAMLKLAPGNQARIQVRHCAMWTSGLSGFVKAYMHNGYLRA